MRQSRVRRHIEEPAEPRQIYAATHPKKTQTCPRAQTSQLIFGQVDRLRFSGDVRPPQHPLKLHGYDSPLLPSRRDHLAIDIFFSFYTSSRCLASEIEKKVVVLMGRGKVVLRRIDDKTVRKVTFSKRRQGFFKKASELSVLCGCEVAALAFSSTRRAYSFSHPGSIEVTVQRYHEHKLSQDDPSDQVERGQRLGDPSIGAVDNLQTTLGFFMNLSIEDLNLSELVQLECQLYETLKEIFQLKNQMIEKSNNSLQGKVEAAALPAEKEVMNEDA